ncbi:MAG: hypothetical protein IPM91_04060 [Bacteroidetes bacterium]|nr:hypothetical protein [Bacteroidota bacterium]
MKKLLLVITGLIFSMSGSSQSWTYSNASGGRNNADGTLGLEKTLPATFIYWRILRARALSERLL